MGVQQRALGGDQPSKLQPEDAQSTQGAPLKPEGAKESTAIRGVYTREEEKQITGLKAFKRNNFNELMQIDTCCY